MTIDTKAILARADEAMDLVEKTSQQGPRRVDPCALIPQLAADVRALVAEVERLSLVADQAVSAIEGVCREIPYLLGAVPLEVDHPDSEYYGPFSALQNYFCNGYPASIAKQLREAGVSETINLVAGQRDEATQRAEKAEARVKELEARDAERLRPGHQCDFSADLTVMTTRAELAEARVKELEARHISDCEHAKIIQGANETLAGDLKRAQMGNALMEAHGAALEKAEARVKELEAENSLIRGSCNRGWAAFHEAEADADALGKTALEQAERAKKAEARVKELEDRDAERLRPGHACDSESRLGVAVEALDEIASSITFARDTAIKSAYAYLQYIARYALDRVREGKP